MPSKLDLRNSARRDGANRLLFSSYVAYGKGRLSKISLKVTARRKSLFKVGTAVLPLLQKWLLLLQPGM